MVHSSAVIVDELIARARKAPPENVVQFRSRVGANQYLRLHRLVEEYVPAGAAVLDWGAGNGHFSYFLARSGYVTTSFALSPTQLAYRPEEAGYEFVEGDPGEPTRLPFASESFDAVASIGVLEHVRETGGSEAGSLGEIRRVLKPGGLFVCYHFPNRDSLIERIASRVPSKFSHLYTYSESDIRSLCSGADLEVLHVARYGILPRNSGQHWPGAIRESRRVAALWEMFDRALIGPLSRIAQNFCFVARRALLPGSPNHDRPLKVV